jgi:hypothetical protein
MFVPMRVLIAPPALVLLIGFELLVLMTVGGGILGLAIVAGLLTT